ncbi:acetyl-CoA carboxylase biotin carboxyl carrier protein [Anaerobacillus isosaccharinicus]|uniref:Biotin carboxyl carrier protein of acetyl-CoA carboxylase n=1 Tax=Anaerobacillus isosaccharinicus TaxID=1532552 RepID=A0A1S2LFX8_9BACI|nr:acetyl-CoA carboxylase biotin carboxyl carrier protein [Anaerobacillus isosaccharinicus]MBA5587762.1 acetyl-CoA carboxylase biotin carboxyl carrier protein [Anaerobacillus isosaccharinicus]QOY34078.1 acetyl-CoA carboxylase biotin carboxyl carrier protein [Anaerobacillus isosaccharinicus]
MFKVNDLRELIRAVDRSNIDELIVKGENNEKVVIRKKGAVVTTSETVEAISPAPVAQSTLPVAPPPSPPVPQEVKNEEPISTPVPAVEENLHKITSPMVGTFYAAASPDSPPYVKKGDQVKNDSVVCIVEAMKLMNELEAEVNGEIVEVLVENGQLVEYGQPLFLVRV